MTPRTMTIVGVVALATTCGATMLVARAIYSPPPPTLAAPPVKALPLIPLVDPSHHYLEVPKRYELEYKARKDREQREEDLRRIKARPIIPGRQA